MITIDYVGFKAPISVGGDFHSLDYWSREKHGRAIDVTEKGNFLVLTVKADGTRRRVPIASVTYISERGVDDGKPVK